MRGWTPRDLPQRGKSYLFRVGPKSPIEVGRALPCAPRFDKRGRLAAAVAPERRYGAPRKRKDCEPCQRHLIYSFSAASLTFLRRANIPAIAAWCFRPGRAFHFCIPQWFFPNRN